MEHIDGDDLAAYVENYTNENGYLSETEALRYIDQIGQALECVHERKLLHRDVKPNNILLRRESKEAVLIDFGLAREFQPGKIRSMTATKTEGYAPIEQYQRRGDFGYYTDVYALAATLYSLLTNRVPIPANYRAEEDVKLSPPQKFNQNISDKVNAAILKGMELEPVNRPQSVREFRELLGLINQEVQLISSCGMDYRKLRDYLAQGKWQEADRETARVMLAVVKQEENGYLSSEHIDNFPCEDLLSIDQLWVKYSNGRFGFSVQNKIYQSLGGTKEEDQKIWEAFGDVVGWTEEKTSAYKIKIRSFLDYRNITFNIKAPIGHLPLVSEWLNWWTGWEVEDVMVGGWIGGLGRWDGGSPSDLYTRLCVFSRIETCYFPNTKSEIQNSNLSPLDDIKLISAVGLDYRKLRDLLAQGKWNEADAETARVMLVVAKREKEGWLDDESIDNFPCEDLRTIDQLWVKYSDGKFGFSVQKRIYQGFGGTREFNSEIWDQFGDKVGWRKGGSGYGTWWYYKDATFDLKAPEGHLPSSRWLGHINWWSVLVSSLASRLVNCNI
jgi:serine/threonine protein kinase